MYSYTIFVCRMDLFLLSYSEQNRAMLMQNGWKTNVDVYILHVLKTYIQKQTSIFYCMTKSYHDVISALGLEIFPTNLFELSATKVHILRSESRERLSYWICTIRSESAVIYTNCYLCVLIYQFVWDVAGENHSFEIQCIFWQRNYIESETYLFPSFTFLSISHLEGSIICFIFLSLI